MSEWCKVRLGDVCTFNYGKSLTVSNRVLGEIPVYSSAGITGWHNEALVASKGIIVGRKGTVGTVYYSETPFCCIDTAYYILPDDLKYNFKYLYYRLDSLGLKKLNEDSAVPGLNRETAYSQVFFLPPIEEQKAIAETLSCLDDKIELNNRINKNLEQQAQAIFKSWFVDFEPFQDGEFEESEMGMIPKGWRVGTLGECTDFLNGYAFSSRDLLDNETDECYHVFKMGHIKKGGGFNASGTKSWVKKSDYTSSAKYMLKHGDLLMCMTDMKGNVALLGHTALMYENNKYIVNQRVGLIRANNNKGIDYPFLYLLTNHNEFLENLRGRANSGVQVNLSTYEIKASKFILAPVLINEQFDDIVKPLFKSFFANNLENERLKEVRDLLLPKLMSGEIDVSQTPSG